MLFTELCSEPSKRDTFSNSTMDLLQLASKVLSSSRMYAIPPDIPAAKFLPVFPKTITTPPVIYSQP